MTITDDAIKLSSKTDSPVGKVEKDSEFHTPGHQQVVDSDFVLADFTASYINLVKTIIGSGILGLPAALVTLGLLPGVVMMFIAAGLCVLGLHLLNVAAMQLGRKSSFSGLCSITYPKAAFAFELAIAIKCMGAGISYLSIAGKTSRGLAEQLLIPSLSSDGMLASLSASKAFWTFLFAACIAPICLMRKMDSLKYTSFAGLATVLYLVLLTIWNFFKEPTSSFLKIPLFPAKFTLSICSAYSMFVFAFTCHHNILAIQNEAKDNTPSGMMSIVGSSVITSAVPYFIVSLFGAATYGTGVKGVILDSFPKNELPFILARFMYVFLLVLSFPLQVFPGRLCIEKMALMVSPNFSNKRTLYLASTFGIISLCTLVGALDYEITLALKWVGATAGTFICYFLPAIIYNKLYSNTKMDWRRISAIGLFFAGCLTLVLSVVGLIFS